LFLDEVARTSSCGVLVEESMAVCSAKVGCVAEFRVVDNCDERVNSDDGAGVSGAPKEVACGCYGVNNVRDRIFRPLLTSSLPMEIAVKEDQESFAAAVRVWRSPWRFSKLKIPANIFLL